MKGVGLTVLLCLLLAACMPGGSGGSAGPVSVSGALFLDLHVDSQCSNADAPPPLSGVRLTFRGPERQPLGEAVSGPIGHRLLEFGPGKDGWEYPGCRFVSLYSAELERAESYSVTFRAVLLPGAVPGVGFTGIDELGEQTISHAELEANGFAWDFEVSPSYVVGH